MHPDQATDLIVDAALRYGKPFAVVPCCVFPNHHPNRRIASRGSCVLRELLDETEEEAGGTTAVADADADAEEEHVRTYEQYLTWLEKRAPGIQREVLKFDGRNVVLFNVPPQHSLKKDNTT